MDEVILTSTTDQDVELIMAWRSNPFIYEYFYIQKAPLTWEEHIQWWIKTKNSKDKQVYLIWYNNRRVGLIILHSFSTGIPEVDIHIGEVTLWGKKVGKRALQLLIERNKGILSTYKAISARIAKGNVRSQKLFEASGFEKRGEGRPGEWYYEKRFK